MEKEGGEPFPGKPPTQNHCKTIRSNDQVPESQETLQPDEGKIRGGLWEESWLPLPNPNNVHSAKQLDAAIKLPRQWQRWGPTAFAA